MGRVIRIKREFRIWFKDAVKDAAALETKSDDPDVVSAVIDKICDSQGLI